MVEKFLTDLFRRTQKQKIAVVIDGKFVSKLLLESLPKLVEKLREVGDVKYAEVIYENKIPDLDYEFILQAGFAHKVVAGNLDLNFLIQTFDLILSDKSIDMIVLGTNRENLIPLFTELRKIVTVYGLVEKSVSKAFDEAFDEIININDIEEYSFMNPDITEIENLIGLNSDTQIISSKDRLDVTNKWENTSADANIGPMSEALIEQVDLEKEIYDSDSGNGDSNTTDLKIKKTRKKKPKKKTTKKPTKKAKKKKSSKEEN